MGLTLIDGNEAIAWAAAKAGCQCFAGYPITPATPIFTTLLKILPPKGGICLQGEDEIASMGICLGASMAGMKAMTATSGPGISLCSEHISFAIGSEIPIVIVDVQRLGPSTGSATKGADGDILFLRWGHSSGLPAIVLAPVDVSDCLRLTVIAFNLAETYRCPVFIASNKEISMTRESIDLEAFEWPAVRSRKQADLHEAYLPFKTNGHSMTPDFLPIGGVHLVRQTSSTHGPDGYITMDPDVIESNQRRLQNKLRLAVRDFTYFDLHRTATANTLVITYGITARAVKDAVSVMGTRGKKNTDLLVLKTLWPVPEHLITTIAGGYSRVVVVEMNLGQYVREIRRLLPDQTVDFLGQMNGELISPNQILEVLADG